MSEVMNAIPEQVATVNGPWKVDATRGTHRSEVSQQWISRPMDERYLSLPELRDAVGAEYIASRSDVVDNRGLEFLAPTQIDSKEDLHKLSVGLPSGAECDLSHWAFGQACGLAKAPAGYLRTLPSQLVRDNLNFSLSFNREIEQVKAYYQPEKGLLRAVTGPTYGRVPDVEVVDAIMGIAGNGDGERGWKVPGVMNWSTGCYDPNVPVTKETTTLFASDRDLFVFLVDDRHPIEVGKLANGDPDLMFRGFYVTNSEVGLKSLVIGTMYLRGICCNRILWGVEHFSEISIRHSRYAPDRFMIEASPALRQFAEGDVRMVQEGVAKAKAAKVAEDEEAAMAFLRKRDFSKDQAAKVLETVEREEGHPARSAWDMAQGITALARHIPHQDRRLQLEAQAAKILDKVAA